MKKIPRIHLFFLCMIFLLPAEGYCAKFHAILVCDTIADNIEESVISDMHHVSELTKKIAKYTGLPLVTHILCYEKVNTLAFTKIKNLEFNKDDTVFFYFSGHGFNVAPSENEWPKLFLTPSCQGIDCFSLYEELKKKQPRLLIAMVDCCNNILPNEFAPPVFRAAVKELKNLSALKKRNYRSLFHEMKGAMLLSGSSYGEFAWSAKSGGLFTNALIESLEKAVETKEAKWENILESAGNKVIGYKLNQTPLYLLEILKFKSASEPHFQTI